jgi:hypothetical protein
MLPRIPGRKQQTTIEGQIADRLEHLTRVTDRPRPLVTPGVVAAVPRIAQLIDRRGNVLATIACDAEVGMVVLGRGAGCQVHLDDRAVSECHAALEWDAAAGAHMLRDLGSTNGTRLNNRRIRGRIMVLDGARLRFGRTEVRYEVRPV